MNDFPTNISRKIDETIQQGIDALIERGIDPGRMMVSHDGATGRHRSWILVDGEKLAQVEALFETDVVRVVLSWGICNE